MNDSKSPVLNPAGCLPIDPAGAVHRQEVCALAPVRRVAAMLDLDPDALEPGQNLPRGWHFLLLAADTRRSALRSDGFPGLGVPLPDLGLPRLVLAGRSVRFAGDIPIGARVERSSAVTQVRHTSHASGPLAWVDVEHRLWVDAHSEPVITETQTYRLSAAEPAAAAEPPPPDPSALQSTHRATALPDEILLFQYSALGFNSHRIHLDRDHARSQEGFADLVVNGGLTTLLLTEFLRGPLGLSPRALRVRHRAPLFCGRALTMTADPAGSGWTLRALDEQARLAVEMNVEVE